MANAPADSNATKSEPPANVMFDGPRYLASLRDSRKCTFMASAFQTSRVIPLFETRAGRLGAYMTPCTIPKRATFSRASTVPAHARINFSSPAIPRRNCAKRAMQLLHGRV